MKPLTLCLALAFCLAARTLWADAADHSADDAFAAEAQALAPRVTAPDLPPPPPGVNDTMGVWGPVIEWTPHIPVSAAQLPDGRVLTFASNRRTTFPTGVEFTYAATWNPTTGVFVEYNHPTHDMFCGGIVMLPDGRVLVNGGRNEVVRASTFDYRTNQWVRIQNMNGGRWYNTSIALPNGQVWTVTGSGTGIHTSERWNETTGWNVLTGIPWAGVLAEPGYITNWHPFIVLNADGRLFHFGPTDLNRWITHTGSGSMTSSGTNVPGVHYPKEGAWVMYDEGRILVAGGGINTLNNAADSTTGNSATDAYTVNLNTNPPTLAVTSSMGNARQFANAVVLPNGEVLVMGGNTSGLKFNDTGSVFAAEIWNPTTGLWRTVASASVPRNYHSLALLLPDGRVLSGGGGLGGNAADHQDAQLYTPPMLYNPDGSLASRPVIDSAPAQIGAGSVFSVNATPGITQFAFIKMSAITHSMNTDLRRIVLPSTETAAGLYTLTAHSNLNVMTPGYWMLFGILPSGVYSQAAIVQVDATGSVSLANPGNQATVLNSATSLQMVSSGPAGVPRTYSATGLPPGLSISTAGLISGTASALGTFNVRVTVTGGASSSFQDFTWTVSPPTLVQNFPSFPNGTGFTINGDATVTSSVLRLTPNTTSRTGSAFLTAPVSIGADTSFTTRFVFRQHGTGDGADGMAFVVQGVAADALGSNGGGLGYAGIAQSLAVEIDSYQSPNDPNGNHLAVTLHGDATSHPAIFTPAFDMENAASHTLWVEYDGPADIVNVYLAQGIVTTRPATPVMTAVNVNLSAITGGAGWFGFTGGTGGLANSHDIEAWSLNVNANALPAPPVVTNPGSRTSVVNTPTSLQIVATDINGDILSYSATGLPAGLTIAPGTGLISGTPTTPGTGNVTVTVDDGSSAPVHVNFTWTVNDALTALPLVGAPVVNGTNVTFTGQSTGGLNPQYKWNFGDGSPETAFSSAPGASHLYAGPGRYLVTLTVRDSTGAEVTTSFHQAIHAALTAQRPRHSSSIAFEDRATGNDRIWCVNPDNNSVSVIDATTRARIAEVTVGTNPRSVAVAPDGRIWVINAGSATLSILNSATPAVAATVSLPRAARPHGLAFDPNGTYAWVACEESGQLLRLNPTTGAQHASIALGANIRHVSVSADSTRVFVSRFVSPPVPGEGTASPQTEVAGVKHGGEVIVVNAASDAIERTIVLQHSEEPDTSNSARGIPNYVGGVALSPDGLSAWVPSKQDNIKRGTLRSGQPLTHDMALRAIASRLALDAGLPTTDVLDQRVDFDNAGIPSASAFDSKGIYLFTALEGSRTIAVLDAWSKQELFRFNAGRAPQGLVLAPDDRTLYVHNFMDRTVTIHHVGAIIDGGEVPPPIANTVACVTTDLLSATVLRGKQLFYDAKDERVALQEYLSCASCHNDGGQDGRVWDFTQFGEGLRNTQILRSRGGMNHGPLHWTGNFDEVQDFEGQIRNFAGGLGLMSDTDFHAGTRSQPLGQPKAGLSSDLDALAAYVASLTTSGPSPQRNNDGTLTAAAVAGEQVFRQANCASCHSGTRFTESTLGVFRNVGTLKPSSGQRLGAALTGLDTPSLRSAWNSGPYLHDGSAATVSDAIAAHVGVNLNATDLANLAAYVLQIDDSVTTAPIDSSAPSVILATATSTVAGPFSVTVTVSEPVTGLVAGDFTVTNGAVSAFTGSGASYGFTVTPTIAGNVTVTLPINSCIDASGNGNAVSNTLTVNYAPPQTGVNGLTGEYYSGINFQTFVFTRVDPTVNFAWAFDEGPSPAMAHNFFSARWTGQAIPQFTETYTFIVSADDGVRLWLNNQLVVDQWHDQGTTSYSVNYAATAGVPVDIRIDYYQNQWGAVCRFEWQSASQARQVIPTTRLSTGATETRPVPALSTGSSTVSGSFPVAVAFNEAVTGLSAGDFAIVNGTATNLTGSGAAYTLTVAPEAPGPITVNLPSNSCLNSGGQTNVASNTIAVTYTPPVGAVVNGLSGDYYSGRDFERFVVTRVDPTVNMSLAYNEGPAPGIGHDLFSVRWTGQVISPTTETRTFIVTADDGVRLWLNNQLVVDQWHDQGTTSYSVPLAVTAGVPVDIRIDYYQNLWGAVARLEWQSATQTRQVIPRERLTTGAGGPVPLLATASATVTGAFPVSVTFGESVTGLAAADFIVANGTATALSGSGAAYTLTVTPAANGEVTVNLPANSCFNTQNQPNTAGNTLSVTYSPPAGALLAGLKGEYYAGKNFESLVLTRIDETINFAWLINSPAAGVPANQFSVRWTGKVTALHSETYTFFPTTDDGVRLWVNGVLLVDRWNDQGPTTWPATIALTAGTPVDIRMDYYDNEWGATARLEWQSASQVRQIIPRDRLSTPAPAAPPEAPNFSATRLSTSGTDATTDSTTVATPPAPGILKRSVSSRVAPKRRATRPTTATALEILNASRGLRAEYFAGDDFETFITSQTDERVAAYWPAAAAPLPGVPASHYSVRWTGRLRPLLTGNYTFYVATDEGVRLWVNDRLVVDRWTNALPLGGEKPGVPVMLRAGQSYKLRLEYQNTTGDGWIDLKWESPSVPREIIPATRLFQPK
jgi:YVTN family beta-propeller protein